jgi:hypothetical protein
VLSVRAITYCPAAVVRKCASIQAPRGTLHRTLPPNGKHTFILPFRLQAPPLASICRVFTSPFQTQILLLGLSHRSTPTLPSFLLFLRKTPVKSTPYSVCIGGASDNSGARPVGSHMPHLRRDSASTLVGTTLHRTSTRGYPGATKQTSRIRCMASAISRCRTCNWLEQLAHAAR